MLGWAARCYRAGQPDVSPWLGSTVRSVIVMTAIGVPSGSDSRIRSGAASAGAR